MSGYDAYLKMLKRSVKSRLPENIAKLLKKRKAHQPGRPQTGGK
jgi:hypothetical protein